MACYFLLFIFGIFCLFGYLLLCSFIGMVSGMLRSLQPACNSAISLSFDGSKFLINYLADKAGSNQMWKIALSFIAFFSLVGLIWTLVF